MKKVGGYRLAVFRSSLLILITLITSFALTLYAEEKKDKEAPVITINNNNLFFYDTDEFNFLNYVDVNDNSGEYEVSVVDEENAKLPGIKQVQIEAVDPSGNIADVFIDVTIVSSQEWNEYVQSKTNHFNRRRKENEDFEVLKGNVDYDAFHLAEEFVGMPGACNEVAQTFINSYFGEEYNIFNTYPVSKEDAMPGDIIYYVDGGVGEQHYAVYLGGASALQGNIYGTTVLGSVYMTYGTEPMFNRLVGK